MQRKDGLPNPKGTLSSKVPAIARATKEVHAVSEKYTQVEKGWNMAHTIATTQEVEPLLGACMLYMAATARFF